MDDPGSFASIRPPWTNWRIVYQTCPQQCNPLRPRFFLYPRHQEIDEARLSRGRDGNPFRNLPPPCKASAATACAGVLGDKDRMPAQRGLPPVVRRIGRRKAVADKVLAMTADRRHPLFDYVPPIGFRKMEARTEPRLRQLSKRLLSCQLTLHLAIIPFIVL